MHPLTNAPAHDMSRQRIRRKRVRHAWSEAPNPQDVLVAKAGWITAGLIVLVAAWLGARSFGWL
jgi:hypothetical protein